MTDLSKRGLSDIEKLKAWFLWREGGFDQRYLDKIANKLNNRPRRILNYLTPNDMIKNHVALTT
ncbi:hypothetical protein [Pseudoalteromonas sp. Ld18]|uniref:hypothetical protein n=1 Tax=Pseudoalteromonas sp. Ld18 TaxID=649163 RepID=UPI0038696365